MYLTISQHHAKMIAAQLRLLAKIFFQIQLVNPALKKIKDIFCPKQYNNLVKAIKLMAGFDGKKYTTPSVVHSACILIKKLGNFVKCLKIKENDDEGMKIVENFMFLLNTSQNSDMTKLATETRTRNQRIKSEILPTTAEINNLVSLLVKDIDECCQSLGETFNKSVWIHLSQLTLLYILVFNRKRPGDVERTEIVEYKTVTSVPEKDVKISAKEKIHASNFARFVARGKLNRSASILLSNKVRTAIDLLLKHRENANVNKDNKYLFADPSKKDSYYDAAIALRKYCETKGFPPGKFTANKLRKHLATSTATLPKETQTVISDFMEHGQEIHNNIYKHRDAFIDIIVMGQVLTDASGFTKKPLQFGPPCNNPLDVVTPEWIHDSDSSSNSDTFSTKKNRKRKVYSKARKNLSVILEENDDNSFLNKLVSNGDNNESLPSTSNSQSQPILNRNLIENNAKSPQWSSSSSYQLSDDERSSDCSERRHIPIQFSRAKNRTWTTPERTRTRDIFSDYLNKGEVPELKLIQERIVNVGSDTFSRSLIQIQGWLRAEIKRNARGKIFNY